MRQGHTHAHSCCACRITHVVHAGSLMLCMQDQDSDEAYPESATASLSQEPWEGGGSVAQGDVLALVPLADLLPHSSDAGGWVWVRGGGRQAGRWVSMRRGGQAGRLTGG